jgi:hypothetical protein
MSSLLYSHVGLAAAVVTLYTAYVGLLFFTQPLPDLPDYYTWSIRLGIPIFIISPFKGALMGSRIKHSVSAINDYSYWLIVGWSKTVGDLRILHFIAMHALQVLPFLYIYEYKSGDDTFATLWTSGYGNTFVSFKWPTTFCTKENYALNRSPQKLTVRSFSFLCCFTYFNILISSCTRTILP